jgi:periplasmic protein CpxP/Spy
MYTFRKNLVVTLAALGIASASMGALAHTPAATGGADARAMSQEARQAKRVQHRAARQATLKEALKLTPAQQPVWQAFVTSMTPPQKGERAIQRLTREQRAALTAPQRLERRIALQKQRTARMEERLSALNSLYTALTPEQRKVFDEQRPRRGAGHHGGRGMMHG